MQITLRACRHNKGLTLKEASRILVVSSDTLRNCEMGITYLNVKDVEKITKLYEVKYDNIIFLVNNNA